MRRLLAAGLCLAIAITISGCARHQYGAKGPSERGMVSQEWQKTPHGGPAGEMRRQPMPWCDGGMPPGWLPERRMESPKMPAAYDRREREGEYAPLRTARDRVRSRLCTAGFLASSLAVILDADHDGKITRKELDDFGAKVMSAAPKGQDYVTHDDLTQAADRVAGKMMLDTLLKRYDKDNDGSISGRELGPDLMRYATLDVNGDGRIDAQDFRIIGLESCNALRAGSLMRQAARQEFEKLRGGHGAPRGVGSTDSMIPPHRPAIGAKDDPPADPPAAGSGSVLATGVTIVTVAESRGGGEAGEGEGHVSSSGGSGNIAQGEVGEGEARAERILDQQDQQQRFVDQFYPGFFDPGYDYYRAAPAPPANPNPTSYPQPLFTQPMLPEPVTPFDANYFGPGGVPFDYFGAPPDENVDAPQSPNSAQDNGLDSP